MGGDKVGSSGEPEKKGLLRMLLEKIRDHAITVVAGAVITAALFVAGNYILTPIRIFAADRSDITEQQAMDAARQALGATVLETVPFRNIDSSEQYIAVLTEADPFKKVGSPGDLFCDATDEGVAPPDSAADAYLLHGDGDHFQVADLNLRVYDEWGGPGDLKKRPLSGDAQSYLASLFGVMDVDRDGVHEVYGICRSLEPGRTYAYWVTVVNTCAPWGATCPGKPYVLEGGGATEGLYSSNPTVTTNTLQFKNLAPWMYQKADHLDLLYQSSDPEMLKYGTEIREWLKKQGTGFFQGRLQREMFSGPIPALGDDSTNCRVKDGSFEWVSFFRGALFGYDERANQNFVVYVPQGNYADVEEMVAGKRYLWLSVVLNGGIMVFDKQRWALDSIPVTGLSAEDVQISRGGPQIVSLDLLNGGLTVDNRPVGLPAMVAPDELAGAATCHPRP